VDSKTAAQSRAEFLAMMEARMQQWDTDVNALIGRRKAAGAMARGAYYEHMKELRAGRKAAYTALRQLQLLSEATDSELRMHMQAAWARMQTTLREIAPEHANGPRNAR
jgi:hypothetical protein